MQAVSSQQAEPESLLEFYTRVRAQTESLCEPLEIEDYIPQPTIDVSPPKWNIAHTTWFFEEMILKKFAPNYKVFDSNFAFLFNSYYNTVGDRTLRDHRGDLSRPTVKRVFQFRHYIDSRMSELLTDTPRSTSRTPEFDDLVILGLNHEQQHQELFLTDLKFTLSVNPLFPAYREGYAPEETELSDTGRFIEMEAGNYEIGYDGDGFCFDNELARHQVHLNDFQICDRLG